MPSRRFASGIPGGRKTRPYRRFGMPRVRLYDIANARSGDKGDGSNVGIIARDQAIYDFLVEELTPARVKAHFKDVCFGEVERYEIPKLKALNFILHDSLGGGGTESLKTDAQGKTHGQGLLTMEMDVPDDLLS